MRREWPFSARSAVWRNACARGDAPRLLADVTGAFVDRRPIDWSALLARVDSSPDRDLFEILRRLDCLRTAAPAAARTREPRAPALLVVRLLAALATLQTVCCLGALAIAWLSGDADSSRGPQIVVALAFAAAGVPLGAAARCDPRGLFLLAGFAAVASAFARPAAAVLPDAYTAPIAPVLRGMYPEAFVPAFVWELALDFPRVRRFTSFDTLARQVTSAAWLLGIALFGINLIAAYGLIREELVVYVLRDHSANGFWSLFALALVPALAVILARSRRAGREERGKVARFAMAIAAGTAPLLLSGLLRMLLPQVNDWLLTAGPAERGWLDRLIVVALAATPILGAAALIVDRPFELRTIPPVRIARGAITAAAAVPIAALLIALYALRHLALSELASNARVWWLLASAIGGLALLLARSRVLNALDRRGYVRADDQHERLSGALERIHAARGALEIGAVLARELRRCAGSAAGILVRDRHGAFVDRSRRITPLACDAALSAVLREAAQPLDCSLDRAWPAVLPRQDREWLATNGIEVAAALKRGDGTLEAVVAVGPKRGGRPFTRRDRCLIATLTSAAAAAWDAGAAAGESAAFECRRCGIVAESTLPCSCGEDAALALLPRHLDGKFAVQRRLGAGGMGVVYLARDTTLQRDVALKTLPSLRRHEVARLRDEARAMAGLNHESVATLYGLELWRRTPILVVEYFANGTLARRLGSHPLTPAAAVRLGMSLARALAYMHSQGVLHRDLKPSNIAFTAAGAPKLLDFGLAAIGDRVAGTPAYMPPEAFRGMRPSPAFDLWALSVVLREAIGADRSLPPPMRAFFERALASRAEDRFQSAIEVLSALDELASVLRLGQRSGGYGDQEPLNRRSRDQEDDLV